MMSFDYDGYTASPEKVLEAVQKDYWTQYVDLNRHQVFVARTYLWVAAAMIGALFVAFEGFRSPLLESGAFGLAAFALAAALAIVAFGICLYAIPARKGYRLVHTNGWGELSHEAYSILKDRSPNLHATFLALLIRRFDVATNHCLKTNSRRAKLLRATSWLLIVSFACALGSGVIYLVRTGL